MKKEFEFPELSIYSFAALDIITTSLEFGEDGSGGMGDNEQGEEIPW